MLPASPPPKPPPRDVVDEGCVSGWMLPRRGVVSDVCKGSSASIAAVEKRVRQRTDERDKTRFTGVGTSIPSSASSKSLSRTKSSSCCRSCRVVDAIVLGYLIVPALGSRVTSVEPRTNHLIGLKVLAEEYNPASAPGSLSEAAR